MDLNIDFKYVNFSVLSHILLAIEKCTFEWFFDPSFCTYYTPHYQCNDCLHEMIQISLLHIMMIKIIKNDHHSSIIP